RRARRRDVRGGARDGLRHELACQRLPGARALRRDRARLGGLDRDRAGPRPRQRAPLALAGLSAGRRPPASSLVPASPHAPRGSAPTRSRVSLLRFAALAGLFLAPTVVPIHSISSRSGGRRAPRSRRGGGTAMIRGGAAGNRRAPALHTSPPPRPEAY